MNADPLEWLLPEAGARERAELRRVVQALRVLRADLTRPGTRSVRNKDLGLCSGLDSGWASATWAWTGLG